MPQCLCEYMTAVKIIVLFYFIFLSATVGTCPAEDLYRCNKYVISKDLATSVYCFFFFFLSSPLQRMSTTCIRTARFS